MKHPTPIPLRALLLVLIIVFSSMICSSADSWTDFAQDYLAARAARDGANPNTPSLTLAATYGVPEGAVTARQNAHPPLTLLLALPFSFFPWKAAHLLWELFLCVAVGVSLLMLRIRTLELFLFAPVWYGGLAIGNVDVIVICLCLMAMSDLSQRRSAVALGLAAALKVYPLLLILGLAATGRYRAFFTALLTGAAATLAATAFLGAEALTGWLLYIPHNGEFFDNNRFNVSLTKLCKTLGIENIKITVLGIGMLLVQFRRKGIEPLLAGMLLISPVSWLHQLALLSNVCLTGELICCSVCSTLMLLSQYAIMPSGRLIGYYASMALTLTVLLCYLRLVCAQRAGRASQS